MPALAASLDRLSQVPERLHTSFRSTPPKRWRATRFARELDDADAAREVVAALAEDSRRRRASPTARSSARRRRGCKEKTGQKGKALFHPIRVALTGEAEGPELDLLVPAIDRATELSPADGLQDGDRLPRTRGRDSPALMRLRLIGLLVRSAALNDPRAWLT